MIRLCAVVRHESPPVASAAEEGASECADVPGGRNPAGGLRVGRTESLQFLVGIVGENWMPLTGYVGLAAKRTARGSRSSARGRDQGAREADPHRIRLTRDARRDVRRYGWTVITWAPPGSSAPTSA